MAHVVFPAASVVQHFTIVLHLSPQHAGKAGLEVVAGAVAVAAPIPGIVSAAHAAPNSPKPNIIAPKYFAMPGSSKKEC
jgi:hypothetical protein